MKLPWNFPLKLKKIVEQKLAIFNKTILFWAFLLFVGSISCKNRCCCALQTTPCTCQSGRSLLTFPLVSKFQHEREKKNIAQFSLWLDCVLIERSTAIFNALVVLFPYFTSFSFILSCICSNIFHSNTAKCHSVPEFFPKGNIYKKKTEKWYANCVVLHRNIVKLPTESNGKIEIGSFFCSAFGHSSVFRIAQIRRLCSKISHFIQFDFENVPIHFNSFQLAIGTWHHFLFDS